jgi:hypothetical protein
VRSLPITITRHRKLSQDLGCQNEQRDHSHQMTILQKGRDISHSQNLQKLLLHPTLGLSRDLKVIGHRIFPRVRMQSA